MTHSDFCGAFVSVLKAAADLAFAGISGFRLIDAGIDVRNRSVRLDVNYRNTREIVEFTTQLLDPDDVVLLDGTVGTPARTVRSGPEPITVRATTITEHDRAFLEVVRASRSGYSPDRSTVVLHEWKDRCRRYLDYLNAHGVPAVALDEWDGAETDAVLVGTPKPAKGLEVAHVFMPDVDPSLLSDPPVEPTEYEARRRREAYVGMTRTDPIFGSAPWIPRDMPRQATDAPPRR